MRPPWLIRHRLWSSILAAFAALLLTAPGSARETYFVEDFFSSWQSSPPALSPDGTRILFSSNRRGTPAIYLKEIGRRRARVLLEASPGAHGFSALGWANDERFFYQEDYGAIYAKEVEGSGICSLAEASRVLFVGWGFVFGNFARPEVINLLSQDPEHVLIAVADSKGRREVRKVNVRSGESTIVQEGDRRIDEWIAAPDGAVLAGFHVDRKGIELRYRESPRSRWRSIDSFLADQEVEVRFRYAKDTVVGRRQHFLGFSGGGAELYFLSNHASDRYALYRFNLAAGGSVEKVFEDPVYDLLPQEQFPGTLALFDPYRHELAGVVYPAATFRTQWVDPLMREIQDEVDARLPVIHNLISGFDRNRNRFLILSHSSREPGRYSVYDRAAGSIEEVGRAQPRLDPGDLAETRPVDFPTPDDRPLHGYLTRPLDWSSDHPAPLIIWLHGGPWARDFGGFDPAVQYFAHLGYSVLQVEFRGSIGFGFKHLDAARQDYGQPAMEDVMAALDWVVAEGIADPGAVAIGGHSYGAYLTAYALCHHSERFRCGIALAGVYDLYGETRRIRDLAGETLAYQHWKLMVGTTSDREQLDAMSPLTFAGQIRVPLFLAHGTEDVISPYDDSKRLAEALEHNGVAVTFLPVKGGDHGFSDRRDLVYVYEGVTAHLRQYLPLNPTP